MATKKRVVNWRINREALEDIEGAEIANGRFSSLPAFVNWMLDAYRKGETIKRN